MQELIHESIDPMGFIYLVPQTTFFEMDGNGEALMFHVYNDLESSNGNNL